MHNVIPKTYQNAAWDINLGYGILYWRRWPNLNLCFLYSIVLFQDEGTVGFAGSGFIEIPSQDLGVNGDVSFSFRSKQEEALLLLAKGTVPQVAQTVCVRFSFLILSGHLSSSRGENIHFKFFKSETNPTLFWICYAESEIKCTLSIFVPKYNFYISLTIKHYLCFHFWMSRQLIYLPHTTFPNSTVHCSIAYLA